MNAKKRFALVGCGGRSFEMFAKPLIKRFSASAELVALCDINPGRMQVYQKALGISIPTFEDFDLMLKKIELHGVLIGTRDSSHHLFILKALDHGLEVITEKPMTTDRANCLAILEQEEKSDKKVTVTFNLRFVPFFAEIRKALQKNAVGKILSIHFEYLLDRRHGADYFRRWHRRRENSGGLLVHKSTHHFDIVNWFLQDIPEQVFAQGSLQFYGPKRMERGINCRTCQHTKTCDFYFDINRQTNHDFAVNNKSLYAEVEQFDGYLRDSCVFADEIDIEDTMQVLVKYRSGALLSYSLSAHAPYEGWRMSISGTAGRLEAEHWKSGPLMRLDGDDIRIYRMGTEPEIIHVPKSEGGHGGGDERLQAMLFDKPAPDPLGQMAGSEAGAYSLLIGDAANRSIKTSLPVPVHI